MQVPRDEEEHQKRDQQSRDQEAGSPYGPSQCEIEGLDDAQNNNDQEGDAPEAKGADQGVAGTGETGETRSVVREVTEPGVLIMRCVDRVVHCRSSGRFDDGCAV